MILNNDILNTAIEHLFQEDLYVIPPTDLVVVLSKNWDAYSPEETSLLSKILASVKLDLSRVKIQCAERLSATELSALTSKKILIFGSQVRDIPSYQHVAQGFSVIRADDLSELDDAKKKSLWLALKNMFSI